MKLIFYPFEFIFLSESGYKVKNKERFIGNLLDCENGWSERVKRIRDW